jgi:hypothetical protein
VGWSLLGNLKGAWAVVMGMGVVVREMLEFMIPSLSDHLLQFVSCSKNEHLQGGVDRLRRSAVVQSAPGG